MYTIDASVHVNALNPQEPGSETSQKFLKQVIQREKILFSPTLLYVEVASAVARVFNNSSQGLAIAGGIRVLPNQVWFPLDEDLAMEAALIGADRRLRGADAVYAAVALRQGATLVTLDGQQIERLRGVIDIQTPQEALEKLGGN